MTVKTFIRYSNYTDEFDVAVVHHAFNGVKFCFPETKFIELKQFEPAQTFLSANMEGPSTSEILQSILNAAWEQGLRPTGFKDIQNETKVLREHLADMRRLVFASHTPYNIVELK